MVDQETPNLSAPWKYFDSWATKCNAINSCLWNGTASLPLSEREQQFSGPANMFLHLKRQIPTKSLDTAQPNTDFLENSFRNYFGPSENKSHGFQLQPEMVQCHAANSQRLRAAFWRTPSTDCLCNLTSWSPRSQLLWLCPPVTCDTKWATHWFSAHFTHTILDLSQTVPKNHSQWRKLYNHEHHLIVSLLFRNSFFLFYLHLTVDHSKC